MFLRHSGPEEPLRVERRHLSQQHPLSGELAAESALEITAPDVGIHPLEILWLVRNGTPVAPGDPLFEFDNGGLAERLEERRVQLLEQESELAAVRSESGSQIAEAIFDVERRSADLEKARIDAGIPRSLKSEEEFARLQLELSKARENLEGARRALETAKLTARADVDLAGLELEESQAELSQVQGGIDELSLEAPVAGLALLSRNRDEERLWQEGDTVEPGDIIGTLPDLDTLIVRARLFDVDEGVIEPGLLASVTLTAFPDRSYPARVRSVDPIALQRQRGSSTRVFWVLLDLEEADLDRMRPGMTAMVTVQTVLSPGGEPPLTVPRASLDLSDLARPRIRLHDGSWQEIGLGGCTVFRCIVEGGLEEGTLLRRATT